jgi:hypothetical protein
VGRDAVQTFIVSLADAKKKILTLAQSAWGRLLEGGCGVFLSGAEDLVKQEACSSPHCRRVQGIEGTLNSVSHHLMNMCYLPFVSHSWPAALHLLLHVDGQTQFLDQVEEVAGSGYHTQGWHSSGSGGLQALWLV